MIIISCHLKFFGSIYPFILEISRSRKRGISFAECIGYQGYSDTKYFCIGMSGARKCVTVLRHAELARKTITMLIVSEPTAVNHHQRQYHSRAKKPLAS